MKLVWWKTLNQSFKSPHEKKKLRKLEMKEHEIFL